MTNTTQRKVGDKVYCKSFGDGKLYHVKIIKVIAPDPLPYQKMPYQVQQIGTSFAWWIDEAHIQSCSPQKD